jgi:hypothetical protein
MIHLANYRQAVQLISFYLYLMFYACAARFALTENLKNLKFYKIFWELNKALEEWMKKVSYIVTC